MSSLQVHGAIERKQNIRAANHRTQQYIANLLCKQYSPGYSVPSTPPVFFGVAPVTEICLFCKIERNHLGRYSRASRCRESLVWGGTYLHNPGQPKPLPANYSDQPPVRKNR